MYSVCTLTHCNVTTTVESSSCVDGWGTQQGGGEGWDVRDRASHHGWIHHIGQGPVRLLSSPHPICRLQQVQCSDWRLLVCHLDMLWNNQYDLYYDIISPWYFSVISYKPTGMSGRWCVLLPPSFIFAAFWERVTESTWVAQFITEHKLSKEVPLTTFIYWQGQMAERVQSRSWGAVPHGSWGFHLLGQVSCKKITDKDAK